MKQICLECNLIPGKLRSAGVEIRVRLIRSSRGNARTCAPVHPLYTVASVAARGSV